MDIKYEGVTTMEAYGKFQFDNFEEMSLLVYRLAFALTKAKVDADDVYQEVFLSYFNNATIFESREHQKAWFIVVTKNACKKLWRNPFYRTKLEQWDDTISDAPDCDYSQLYRALEKLSFKERTIIHLHYFEGYPLNEMADLLNVNYATLRKQMSRARDKLKTIYQLEEEADERL